MMRVDVSSPGLKKSLPLLLMIVFLVLGIGFGLYPMLIAGSTSQRDIARQVIDKDPIMEEWSELSAEEILGPADDATPENAAVGYGVGNWYLYNGQLEEAKGVYRRILLAKDGWAGFGYIAAESDMARIEEEG